MTRFESYLFCIDSVAPAEHPSQLTPGIVRNFRIYRPFGNGLVWDVLCPASLAAHIGNTLQVFFTF